MLSIGFKDCLMYSTCTTIEKNGSWIESSFAVRGRTCDAAIRHMEPRSVHDIEGDRN